MTDADVSEPQFWLDRLLAAILVLVPFDGFLTVWLASLFGHYTAFRLWDEALLALAAGMAIWLALHVRGRLTKVGRWLLGLSLLYSGLHVLIGLIAFRQHAVNVTALGDGLILNLRLIVVLWLGVLAASASDWLKRQWRPLVLIPAAIVSAFAILQIVALPHNFLSHFGYSQATIVAEETIDNNPNFQRAQSTLRGANPLGAYLVIVLAVLAVLWLQDRPRRWLYGGAGALALGALFVSYS